MKCSVPSLVPALEIICGATDKTSFYTVSLHCSIRLKCLSGLCRTVKKLQRLLWGISIQHEAGYICAMLFIIPGFHLSPAESTSQNLICAPVLSVSPTALIIIAVATMFAWMVALLLHLQPVDFLPLNLTLTEKIIFRLLASFCGVFGFSIMFNSPRQLAAAAAVIGAIANTFRLELVDLLGTPSAAAAFLGALTAGLLASLLKTMSVIQDCDHRSIYRYHGSRIIPVPRDLQSRHHVFGCIGLLVCLCDPYHRMPASPD